MKRIVSFSLLLLVAATGIIFILAAFSKKLNIINGFSRTIKQRPLNAISKMDTRGLINDIGGFAGDKIFFSGETAGTYVVTNWQLENRQNVKFDVPLTTNGSFFSEVKDSIIYLFASNVPAIIIWNLRENKSHDIQLQYKFTRAVPLGLSRFLLKNIDTAIEDQVLNFRNFEARICRTSDKLIPIYHDMGFATDGLLLYDPIVRKFVYSFYFSNQFVVFDSSLNRVYTGTTVDTDKTFIHKGVISHRGSSHSFTLGSPPRFVTYTSCTYNGNLYCVSALLADNEDRAEFQNNSVIDYYDLINGKYLGSFYIPKLQHQGIRRIKIENNKIVALYKTVVAIYNLPN